MPHFSSCCGTDEYVCQKCASIYCGTCDPSSYMGDVVPDGRVTNICPSCLEKNTDWRMIAKPKKVEDVAFGTFTGLMYEIKVDDMNKLSPRNVCPHCNGQFGLENKTASSEGKWLFKCPSCSANIQVVR